MTDPSRSWHNLMSAVGIQGPLTHQNPSTITPQTQNPLLSLPFELRCQIWEEVLLTLISPSLKEKVEHEDGESNDDDIDTTPYRPNPCILRLPCQHLCLHLSRPKPFSSLLSTSKQIYFEAVTLPFQLQTFDLKLVNNGSMPLRGMAKLVGNERGVCDEVLAMPRFLKVCLELEDKEVMVQLTRLRLVVESRGVGKDVKGGGGRARETEVRLVLRGFGEIRRGKVIKALPVLLRGDGVKIVVLNGDGEIEDAVLDGIGRIALGGRS